VIIRILASVVIVASTFIVAAGQGQSTQKADNAGKLSAPSVVKNRDMPFPAGVDLQFLLKELGRDLDLNVLFDAESFRSPRLVSIELKNVSSTQAVDYILLQEDLFFEEVGPKTILVAARFRGTSIPQLGVGITLLTDQLARYFGVEGGILINMVGENSPAAKAGLKAGDVIVEIYGEPIKGSLRVAQMITERNDNSAPLKIVRDRKDLSITVNFHNGVDSVLRRPQ
jgi:membrane-associated protease RseP (regulator of RpoE activity)